VERSASPPALISPAGGDSKPGSAIFVVEHPPGDSSIVVAVCDLPSAIGFFVTLTGEAPEVLGHRPKGTLGLDAFGLHAYGLTPAIVDPSSERG
jgi:hypothetical protein